MSVKFSFPWAEAATKGYSRDVSQACQVREPLSHRCSKLNQRYGWQLGLASSLLGISLIAGCGTASFTSQPAGSAGSLPSAETLNRQPAPAVGSEAAPSPAGTVESADAQSSETIASTAAPKSAPQLVRQADLTLILKDVDQGIATISQLTRNLQGDLLTLQDWQPQQNDDPRQVTLTLRVPQQNLDRALDQIRPLGDIQQQSITATDVSDQLVDLTARLRNLRQSETALLKIMNRSGKISEVLEVSRELSSVREAIERIDAQQQQLKRQVAYSTINLTLTSAIATSPNPRPLGETLGTSWQSATQSVSGFTVGLLKISLWLLAYSPYLALISGIAFLGQRLWQRREIVRGEE